MKSNSSIALIENHHLAYYLWKKKGLKHLPLIHFDAHLDISFEYLNNVNIGNFIYHAIKEKIISSLYWVVPGTYDDFIKDFPYLKKEISNISNYDNSNKTNPIFFEDGTIKTTIFNIPLYISTLDDLTNIDEPVLTDIDIDFFIINRVSKNSNLTEIGKRRLWINTDSFISRISKSIKDSIFTTISYSVEKGYTPMVYKIIGDQLAKKLGYWDAELENRLKAGKFFSKFRKSFDKKNVKNARKYYYNALNFNHKYYNHENNYGELFLKNRDFDNAEDEFKGMLKISKDDINSLIGMGIVCIYKKNFNKARQFFLKGLKIDKKNSYCYLYLSYIAFYLKKYKESENAISEYEKITPNSFFSVYLRAKLYERKKQMKLSLKKIQEALQKNVIQMPLGFELLIEKI